MKLEDQLVRIGSYLMFSTVLVSLTLYVLFCFHCVYFGHFSRKKLVVINLNAVIKIYSKMRELCMHYVIVILYIPLTFKKCKFQSQASIFPENNNPENNNYSRE